MNLAQPTGPAVTVDLHDLRLAFESPDQALRNRFAEVYGHLPRTEGSAADIFVGWHIHKLPTAPPPPPGMPLLSEGDLISYYGQDDLLAIRLPKYGLISVELSRGRLVGAVTRACLEVYGAFEDVLMIALAPLYRRRGWYPLHAFAALSPGGRAVLITGEMGSGKTTTGLALLSAGWKLLSNDSPLLTWRDNAVQVLAYPGRLSAFDDSLARFESLARFIPTDPDPAPLVEDLLAPSGPPKRIFRAEDAFEEPWAPTGPAGAVFFPQVVPGLSRSELQVVPVAEAVLNLMPQAIEGWDKTEIGQTLHLLRKLVEQVPCYTLRLAPDVEQMPDLIAASL